MKKGLYGREITLSMVGVVLALLALYGQAHHATPSFDTTSQVTLTGTVARVEWVNPHVYIFIDAESDEGELVRWEIEAQPPAALRRMGWSREMLAVGETIAITGNPAKNGAERALLGQVFEKVDGILYDEAEAIQKMTAAAPAIEQSATSLAGVWTTNINFEVFPHFFFTAEEEKLTAAGKAAAEVYDERTMNPGLSCIPLIAPSSMLMADTKQITITDESVLIASDYFGTERTIHLNAVSNKEVLASEQGYSIGHWEEGTLVINTTHFAPNALGNGAGVPSGSQKRLVERLSVSENGKMLDYSFELFDSEFIAASIAGVVEWDFRPDLQFITEECSIENAQRYLKYF